MFDFLFKRPANKPAELPASPAGGAKQASAAAEQAAARRAEQMALARTLGDNEAGAVEFILQSEFADVRLVAAEHVVSQALLEQVQQAMRNTDRRVAKLMQSRLDVIRFERAEHQRAQASIDHAQRLLDEAGLSPNQVAELDRQWQVIQASPALAEQFAAVRAGLGRRLEDQVSLQRGMMDAVAELRKLAAGGLAPDAAAQTLQRLASEHAAQGAAAEHGSLPKHLFSDFALAYEQGKAALATQEQHQAALLARQGALAEWLAADAATLNGNELKRAWQSFPPLPEGEPGAALQQQFETILAALPVPASAPAPAPTQSTPRESRQQAGRPFTDALDAMEAALQQGLLHLASEHDKTLRDSKGNRLSPAQSERLAQVRAEFKRLADWARWGGNVSREELVKAVEELPAQALGMNELAKKVGSLRERWKALDTQSGAAPKTLWERFDAACTAAYAPVALHFKHLSEERHGNAAKAQALIAETLALGAQAAGDWKGIAAADMRLRQAWTRLGAIDRKEKKRLDGEFKKALAALLAPLEEQRQIETAQREQLIAEVGLLKPQERNTVDILRALQEKWQEHAKALPLERRAEQALWQRFRAACDEVFAKRKEAAHSADHERRAHLHAKEDVCAKLEAGLAPQDGDDKARSGAIAALLREAKHAWGAIGPVPRASEQKIDQRYHAAVAALQAGADAIVQRAGAAQAHALRDKLRLCQAIEGAIAGADDTRSANDWAALWSALQPLSGPYEKVLQQRFADAVKALAGERAGYAGQLEGNRAKLQDQVLRLEIVNGVDSGAEFARARLKMQVEVLQSSLKSGQKPGPATAQFLQLCALPALADARTVSRIEQLLRRAPPGAK